MRRESARGSDSANAVLTSSAAVEKAREALSVSETYAFGYNESVVALYPLSRAAEGRPHSHAVIVTTRALLKTDSKAEKIKYKISLDDIVTVTHVKHSVWQDQLSVTVREACSTTRSDAAPARPRDTRTVNIRCWRREPTGFLCDLISRLVAGRAFLKRSLAGDAKRRVSGVKTTVKGLSRAAWGLAELRAAVEDMAAACRQPRVAQCLTALSEKLISKKIAAMLASDAWASHLTARACSGGPSFAHKQRLRHLAMALPQFASNDSFTLHEIETSLAASLEAILYENAEEAPADTLSHLSQRLRVLLDFVASVKVSSREVRAETTRRDPGPHNRMLVIHFRLITALRLACVKHSDVKTHIFSRVVIQAHRQIFSISSVESAVAQLRAELAAPSATDTWCARACCLLRDLRPCRGDTAFSSGRIRPSRPSISEVDTETTTLSSFVSLDVDVPTREAPHPTRRLMSLPEHLWSVSERRGSDVVRMGMRQILASYLRNAPALCADERRVTALEYCLKAWRLSGGGGAVLVRHIRSGLRDRFAQLAMASAPAAFRGDVSVSLKDAVRTNGLDGVSATVEVWSASATGGSAAESASTMMAKFHARAVPAAENETKSIGRVSWGRTFTVRDVSIDSWVHVVVCARGFGRVGAVAVSLRSAQRSQGAAVSQGAGADDSESKLIKFSVSRLALLPSAPVAVSPPPCVRFSIQFAQTSRASALRAQRRATAVRAYAPGSDPRASPDIDAATTNNLCQVLPSAAEVSALAKVRTLPPPIAIRRHTTGDSGDSPDVSSRLNSVSHVPPIQDVFQLLTVCEAIRSALSKLRRASDRPGVAAAFVRAMRRRVDARTGAQRRLRGVALSVCRWGLCWGKGISSGGEAEASVILSRVRSSRRLLIFMKQTHDNGEISGKTASNMTETAETAVQGEVLAVSYADVKSIRECFGQFEAHTRLRASTRPRAGTHMPSALAPPAERARSVSLPAAADAVGASDSPASESGPVTVDLCLEIKLTSPAGRSRATTRTTEQATSGSPSGKIRGQSRDSRRPGGTARLLLRVDVGEGDAMDELLALADSTGAGPDVVSGDGRGGVAGIALQAWYPLILREIRAVLAYKCDKVTQNPDLFAEDLGLVWRLRSSAANLATMARRHPRLGLPRPPLSVWFRPLTRFWVSHHIRRFQTTYLPRILELRAFDRSSSDSSSSSNGTAGALRGRNVSCNLQDPCVTDVFTLLESLWTKFRTLPGHNDCRFEFAKLVAHCAALFLDRVASGAHAALDVCVCAMCNSKEPKKSTAGLLPNGFLKMLSCLDQAPPLALSLMERIMTRSRGRRGSTSLVHIQTALSTTHMWVSRVGRNCVTRPQATRLFAICDILGVTSLGVYLSAPPALYIRVAPANPPPTIARARLPPSLRQEWHPTGRAYVHLWGGAELLASFSQSLTVRWGNEIGAHFPRALDGVMRPGGTPLAQQVTRSTVENQLSGFWEVFDAYTEAIAASRAPDHTSIYTAVTARVYEMALLTVEWILLPCLRHQGINALAEGVGTTRRVSPNPFQLRALRHVVACLGAAMGPSDAKTGTGSAKDTQSNAIMTIGRRVENIISALSGSTASLASLVRWCTAQEAKVTRCIQEAMTVFKESAVSTKSASSELPRADTLRVLTFEALRRWRLENPPHVDLASAKMVLYERGVKDVGQYSEAVAAEQVTDL